MLRSFDACWLSRFHCWFEESSSHCNSLNVLLYFNLLLYCAFHFFLPPSLFSLSLSLSLSRSACASSCLLTVTSKLHPQMPISICLSISPCFPFFSDQSRQTRIEFVFSLSPSCNLVTGATRHPASRAHRKGRHSTQSDSHSHTQTRWGRWYLCPSLWATSKCLLAFSFFHCIVTYDERSISLFPFSLLWVLPPVTVDHLTHD